MIEPAPFLETTRIVIYSRPGCHLCEAAKRVIQDSMRKEEYTLEEIDIESDAELLRKHRYEIPVITINGIEAFRHRLTPEEFKAWLRKMRT